MEHWQPRKRVRKKRRMSCIAFNFYINGIVKIMERIQRRTIMSSAVIQKLKPG